MSATSARRLALVVVWVPVLIYGVIIAQQFFHTANTAIHLSTDDGVGNISYALATEGRYGFLSSPILAGMARHDGLFSYGPFYFYLGAALIWMFGYNIVLLRSIHLVVILSIAAAGGVWFRGRAAGAVGALSAVGLLMAFERAQWPMVRPDSLVSMFAVVLVICGGVAIRTGQVRYWAGAGLAAACGAFTHLVAWALVPAALVILGIGYLADAQDEAGRWRRPVRLWPPVIGLACGGLLGAAAFYASFGFRIGDQLAFLTDYQQYTGSLSEIASGVSFGDLIVRHFDAAYWYLPYPMAYLVWATLAGATLLVAALVAWAPADLRRRSLAVLAPPAIVWAVYLASLGSYNNFHAGYAVLNQVMWLWTSAALATVTLDALARWPSWQRVAVAGTWIASFAVGVGMLTVLAQRTNYRALAAATWTPIDQYLGHVLDTLPARARAFGSVDFGIEHPGRVQLIQFWDGIKVLEDVPPADRQGLAPDYLVWGSVENGMNASATLAVNGMVQTTADDRKGIASWRLSLAFAEARYALVSLTAGAPYGVTRVYGWTREMPALARPMVHVYSPDEHQWKSAVGAAVTLAMASAPPATIRDAVPARPAVQTLTGELPAGQYLLTIALTPGMTAESAAVFIASQSSEIPSDLTQPSSPLDISPWMIDEPAVSLIYTHPGGPFYVSQFGSGTPAMAGVQAAPILALTNYHQQRRAVAPDQALPASQWVAAFPEIVVTIQPGAGLAVAGNTTLYGYQAFGPRISVRPGQRMRLRVPVTVTGGRGCLGVLDQTELRWLVAPDRLAPEYEFSINQSRTVKPVLADCSGSPAAVSQLKATIGDGSYALWSDRDELYVDQLMQAFADARQRARP